MHHNLLGIYSMSAGAIAQLINSASQRATAALTGNSKVILNLFLENSPPTRSLILQQVSNGVAMRAAVLSHVLATPRHSLQVAA